MSLNLISTSGVIAGSGSIAMSGNCYVRATSGVVGIRVATVPVWSTVSPISGGNTENYATTGSMIRLSTSVSSGCTIGGIDSNGGDPLYGDQLLINVHPSGSGSIILKHESTGSTSSNRFSLLLKETFLYFNFKIR